MNAIPPAGEHGGDAATVANALGMAVDDLIDLSASLNPVAPNPLPVVRGQLDGLLRYPDARAATQALADAMEVDRDRLLITNGGAEAINLLAAELGGHIVEPEFGLYPRTGDGPRWRSNPHNPSGLLATSDETAGVWDEAFFPLATGRWTRGDQNTPVVGSLTKLLACPGLRVGYLLAEPALVERCRRRQPQWSVNGLACAVVPEMLEYVDLPRWSAAIANLRHDLETILRGHGLAPYRSDANWVLVDAPGLRARLAPQGVLVRDCSSFGLPGTVRIAVPNEAGLARLDAALSAIEIRSGQ